jgi:hypothetical protein
MSWNGPESLHGLLSATSISAVSWAPGRLDIVGNVYDGTLLHWWFDNGWGNDQFPENLGGEISSGVRAVSWAPGRLDIFGVGADSTLQHWWFDHGWGNNARPESLGGSLSVGAPGSGLSAVSWAPGRLDIFGIGTDHTLQHWWFDHGWGNNARPESLGGNLSPGTGLSAVSWAPGRVDIFGIGTDHTLQHWWFDNGWGNNQQPEPLGRGGLLGGIGLTAVSWAPGRLDIFGTSAYGPDTAPALLHWWFDPAYGWGNFQEPEPLGGTLQLPGLSAVSWAPSRLDIFAQGIGDSQLLHWWFDPQYGWGNSQQPEPLGGVLLEDHELSAVSWQPGRLDVFGTGTDDTLQHWWYA